jgi:cell wall-associated NlpC family hydrolase
MTADDIIAAARTAVGTPFVHQGRTVGKALDCAGLVIHVVSVLGIAHHDRTDYPRRPLNGQLQAQLDTQENLKKVASAPLPGDVLLMRFGRDPQHLAIFTGSSIIHAYESVGRVVEHVMDAKWLARIVAAYRFKGLSHE